MDVDLMLRDGSRGVSDGFQWLRLGDLGRCLRGVGYDPDRHLAARERPDTIRLLRANNVQAGSLVLEDVQHVSRSCVSADQVMRRDDVLICTANGSRDLVGKAAPFAPDGGTEYTFGAFMGCFRPDPASIVPEFAARLFETAAYRRQVALALAGSAINNLAPAQVEDMLLPVPPASEQRHIAAVLSDFDMLAVGLHAKRTKALEVRRGITQELFSDATLTEPIARVALGDLGVTYGGLSGKTKSDFGTGNARYITFRNVLQNPVLDEGAFEPVTVSPTERQSRALPGDMFFNGSSETPEEVGMCAVLLGDHEELYLNSFCIGFRLHADAGVDPLYLAHFFRSDEGRRLLRPLAQGSTRYNLSKVGLRGLPVPRPSLPQQRDIVRILEAFDADIAALGRQLAKLRDVRSAVVATLLPPLRGDGLEEPSGAPA
jgi:type I restriction enzyme S subunit